MKATASTLITPLRTGRFILQKLSDSMHTAALRRKLRQEPVFLPPDDGPLDVMLNFPDGMINLYQVRQWYGPLEHLAQTLRVGILCYRPESARQISEETDLKVILAPGYTDLSEVEDVLRPKVILYPNQNYSNYRILGLKSSEHVFICHGESDKIYMASNWVKVFNYFFVAGQASRDRLNRHVRNYDVDDRTIMIGRPQIDIPQPAPHTWDDGRITVIYAPTWEGGRLSMRYGSVASHGISLVQALATQENVRVIYRPHPRTGIHSDAFLGADAEIRRTIAVANETDPNAGHLIDETPFGWQLNAADLMIADISAVAYDWLTTGKPLLVTDPVEPEVAMPSEGIMAALPKIAADSAPAIMTIIESVLHDKELLKQFSQWADYYYGDRRPGASLQRFTDAINYVLDERNRNLPSYDGRDLKLSHATVARPGSKSRPTSMLRRVPGKTAKSFQSFSQIARRVLTSTVLTRSTESLVARSEDILEYRQLSPVVVTAMGEPEDLDPLTDWLPALELLDRSARVTIIVGNLHAYRNLKRRTRLRILVGVNATVTESYYSALAPSVDMQFDQAKMNLREAGHNTMSHVYVGSSRDLGWLNNRLRLFDSIILPPNVPTEAIRKSLIRFPECIDVFTVEDEESDSARANALLRTLHHHSAGRQAPISEEGKAP